MLQAQKLTSQAKAFVGLNTKAIDETVIATIINKKVEDVKNLKVTGKRTAPLLSLRTALGNKDSRNFILECKKSSPTLGDFCKDFDLDKLLDCYKTRAAAISVLCEEHFFKGSLDYLKYVKEHCNLPIICKDFIICKEQITNAYNAGADAVLLMLSVLSTPLYEELFSYAKTLGLDVLTEVDDLEQAQYTIDKKIEIVGINNRNLKTLKIDLNVAKKLSKLFPATTKLVSESGINTHKDLEFLGEINNFLIGSSLTKEQDITFKANSMLYGLNKLCGITTEDALKAAICNHATLAGLIFCEKSPRFIDVKKAKEFVIKANNQISFVGVFVDENVEKVIQIAKKVKLSFVQLHGEENIDYIKELKEKAPQLKIIKAINVKNPSDLDIVSTYKKICDLIILDSNTPGSGKSFDWGVIPNDFDKSRVLLSGGIGLDNVKDALQMGFEGLDLNSKLEITKGVKDVDTVNKVFSIINKF